METASVSCPPGKKILLVEDDERVRTVCEAVLRRNGFECIVATNGAEGLESYRERHEEICLVLSDVIMPVKNGVEMFHDILDISAHANVILMSGYDISKVVPEDLRKLCSVLGKPFTAATLMQSVQKCLRYDEEHKADEASSRDNATP